MRDMLQRIKKRKMQESLNKQFMKAHRELITGKIKEAQVKKSRVKEGLNFKKKQVDLMIKKDLAYTERNIPVQFIAQGLPSAQKARFFSKRKSILDWEKGKTLMNIKYENKFWLSRNSKKVVDSLAEALFEHNMQRGIIHGDLKEGYNIVIQKGKKGIKAKFIDYSEGEHNPSYEMNREKFKEHDVFTEFFHSKGADKKKVTYSKRLHKDLSRDYKNVLNVIKEFPVSEKKKQELVKRFNKRFEKLAEEKL